MNTSCIAAILPLINGGAHSTIQTVALTLAIPFPRDLNVLVLEPKIFTKLFVLQKATRKHLGSIWLQLTIAFPGSRGGKLRKQCSFFQPWPPK